MRHGVLIGRLGRSSARKRKLLWQLTSFVLGQCWDQRLVWGKERYWIDGWMIGKWRMG